jgi:hypothetical protein
MQNYIINALAQILSANQGNRITPELSTGILTSLNQVLTQALPETQPVSSEEEGGEPGNA